jgi:hypothetical protein
MRNTTSRTLDQISDEIENSSGSQRDLWIDAFGSLNKSHKIKINKVLNILKKAECLNGYLCDLDVKIIQQYSSAPLKGQPLLVFGHLAKVKFKSWFLRLSLTEELGAFPKVITENSLGLEPDGSFKLDYFIKNKEKFDLSKLTA